MEEMDRGKICGKGHGLPVPSPGVPPPAPPRDHQSISSVRLFRKAWWIKLLVISGPGGWKVGLKIPTL